MSWNGFGYDTVFLIQIGKLKADFIFFPFLTAVSYIFKRAYEKLYFLYVQLVSDFLGGASTQYSLKNTSV